jgi:hypothetical protein
MEGPSRKYATAGVALWIIWPQKLHNYDKVDTLGGGFLTKLGTRMLV